MNNNLDIATTTFSGLLTALQTDEVFKWIGFILTLLSALLGIIYRIWHWYNEAKEDGKIDSVEIDEFGKIVKDSVDEITNIVKDKDNKKKKSGT